MLLKDEEIALLGLKDLTIIQKKSGFRFGTDAVLLARFAMPKRKDRVVDLCSGTGIVPILLSGLYSPREIAAVELLPQMADMARRSMEMNHLSGVSVFCRDLKDCHRELGSSFDMVTCNPPYMKLGVGKLNQTDELTVARHEIFCTLEDCIREAACLLKFGGRFSLVHRPERLADIITLMRQYRLEPKRMQWVHPARALPPNLVLIEAAKGRQSSLRMEPPVYMYNDQGEMISLLSDRISDWKEEGEE